MRVQGRARYLILAAVAASFAVAAWSARGSARRADRATRRRPRPVHYLAALAAAVWVTLAIAFVARGYSGSASEPIAVDLRSGILPDASLQALGGLGLLALPTPAPPEVAVLAAEPVLEVPAITEEAFAAVEPPAPAAAIEAPVEEAPQIVEYLDYDMSALVFDLINQERAARGLATLAPNDALAAAAQSYAQALSEAGTLSHSLGGSDVLARAQERGFVGEPQMGEVLWMGGGDWPPEQAALDWLASPGHAAVVLDPVYTRAGAGCFVREGPGLLEMRCVMDLAG
jgi:uncharacterized protein YkwD